MNSNDERAAARLELTQISSTIQSPLLRTLLQDVLHTLEEKTPTPSLSSSVQNNNKVETIMMKSIPSEVTKSVQYNEIRTFGWQDSGYGKSNVQVYITSGINGVGDLPKEAVEATFTSNGFDLKVIIEIVLNLKMSLSFMAVFH